MNVWQNKRMKDGDKNLCLLFTQMEGVVGEIALFLLSEAGNWLREANNTCELCCEEESRETSKILSVVGDNRF